MKVYGQLEYAQLENLTSAPTGTLGRLFLDTDATEGPNPYMYNGSSWERILTDREHKFYDAGSSGSTKTVNWNNGKTQKLTLTGHVNLTFTNPSTNGIYDLVVVQDASTAYTIKFPSDVGWQGKGIRQAPVFPGQVRVYRFRYNSGILSAVTTFGTILGAPVGTLPGSGIGVAFSPDGKWLAVASSATPYVKVYPFVEFADYAMYGAPVANPGTLPTGAAQGVAWSPDGNFLAVAHAVSPYLTVYPWLASGFGTKVSDPGTLPVGTCNSVVWHPGGKFVIVGGNTTPYVEAYNWAGGGFGSKLSAPATTAPGAIRGVAVNRAGDYVFLGSTTTPYILAYAFSAGSAAWGAKVSDPGSLPAGQASVGTSQVVAVSPDDAYVAFAHQTTPFLTVYPFSGGSWGSPVTSPATLPVTVGVSAAWSPDGTYLACGHSGSPYISVYPWSAGFGTKVADPGVLPTCQQATAISWSPNGRFIALVGSNSPYISTYPAPRVARNYTASEHA